MNSSLKLPIWKDGEPTEKFVLLDDLEGDGDTFPSEALQDNDDCQDTRVWFERALMPNSVKCRIRYEFGKDEFIQAVLLADGDPIFEYLDWRAAAVAVELG